MTNDYSIYANKLNILNSKCGAFIGRFSKIEEEIVTLAIWSLNMDYDSAAPILQAFKNFSPLLDFTHNLLKNRLDDHKHLNSLVEALRELSGDRNFVAHSYIVIHGPMYPNKNEPDYAKSEPKVGPKMISHFAGLKVRREPMDIAELDELIKDALHLYAQITEFSKVIMSDAPLSGNFLNKISSRRPRLSERLSSSDKIP